MHVLALDLRLHVREARSLKDKRSAIRPIVDRLPRLGVAVSEIDQHDALKTARLGVVSVSGSSRQAEEIIDEAERVVWSRPDVEVLSAERTWMELES